MRRGPPVCGLGRAEESVPDESNSDNRDGEQNRYLHVFPLLMNYDESWLRTALNKFWKLRALDSLETEHELPIGERNRIISTLIDNEDIIKVLVKHS